MRVTDFLNTSYRKFGMSFGLGLLIFIWVVRGNSIIHHRLNLLCPMLFFSTAILKPSFLKPFYLLFKKIRLLLSTVLNPFVMFILFYGILAPISLMHKLSRKRVLLTVDKNKSSLWIVKNHDYGKSDFENQF